MRKVWVKKAEPKEVEYIPFFDQLNAVKKPNYSALEILFELEIKSHNRPNKL